MIPTQPLNFEDVINKQLIPWTEKAHTDHILVMPADKARLPAGVQVTPKEVTGPRVPLKNYRPAGQISVNTDSWPEVGLCAKSAPLLMWVISGWADVHIGSQSVHCGEGNAMLVPAGLPHPAGTHPYAPAPHATSILIMRVCGRGFRAYITHSQNGQNVRPRPGESLYFPNERIVPLFEMLCEELLAGQKNKYCFHSLMHLLLTLQRDLIMGQAFNIALAESGSSYSQANRVPGYSPVESAKAYISSHLGDPLTIEQVAKRVHMSRSNFARLFRLETGQTFLEYIHERRIELAQAILRETDWTVRSVSELCGFGSWSSFNRLFASHVGMTPLAYRAQHRESGSQSLDD